MRNTANGPKFRMALIIMLSATLFAGCAGNRTKLNDTEADYYYSAQKYLDKKNYTMAIERFNELESRFPFGLYAKAGLLHLMYAHYEFGDYTEALGEADRFTRLNSDHPNVDYAWFVRAMSYYQLFLSNSGIFGKADPAQRTPQQAVNAFQALERFTTVYPDSEYREEALKAMIILKDALARHELIVADFYIRKGAWIAATERAQTVVSNFHGVSVVADAWVVLIEAYDALDLPEERQAALQTLKSQFPDHPALASGEYRSPKWEEDRWWIKVLTLGLTS